MKILLRASQIMTIWIYIMKSYLVVKLENVNTVAIYLNRVKPNHLFTAINIADIQNKKYKV